jgi:hypothetical protein
VAVGEYAGVTSVVDVAAWPDGGCLTVDVDQGGAAYNLTVTIQYE